MHIIKLGDLTKSKKGEFHFTCKNCNCEWYADRGDTGLKISAPCFEFFVYMRCPNCNAETITR